MTSLVIALSSVSSEYKIYNNGKIENKLYVYDASNPTGIANVSGGNYALGQAEGNVVTVFIPIKMGAFFQNIVSCSTGSKKRSSICPFVCGSLVANNTMLNGDLLRVSPICNDIAQYIKSTYADLNPDNQVFQTYEYVDCSSQDALSYCAVQFIPNVSGIDMSIDTNYFLGKASLLDKNSGICNSYPQEISCSLYDLNKNETSLCSISINSAQNQNIADAIQNGFALPALYFDCPWDSLNNIAKQLFSSEGGVLSANSINRAINRILNNPIFGYSYYPQIGTQNFGYAPSGNDNSVLNCFTSCTLDQGVGTNASSPCIGTNGYDYSTCGGCISNNQSSSGPCAISPTMASKNLFNLYQNNSSDFTTYWQNYICLNTNLASASGANLYPNSLEKMTELGIANLMNFIGSYGAYCQPSSTDINSYNNLLMALESFTGGSYKELVSYLGINYPSTYQDMISSFNNNCCLSYFALQTHYQALYSKGFTSGYQGIPCFGSLIQSSSDGSSYMVYTCDTMNAYSPEYLCTFIYKIDSIDNCKSGAGCDYKLVQSYCSAEPVFAFSNNLGAVGACSSIQNDVNFLGSDYFQESDIFSSSSGIPLATACKNGIINLST